ncbi:histidine--tRNA ligase [Candidatus Woesearchaeota archaeon]|nr:histidine--tRNA ligase [Candidatus Woesearchaeota archaeon]
MAEVERAKGTREVNPEDKLLMNHVVDNLRRIFELYGFLPLETPTLQKFDVLASKYAGGAEILKETFKLNDQGKREIALRYDLTVPLALYIALNPNIKLPFKRYEVGKVFRDGPISSERFREFWQCDVDIIGSSSMLAEAELINLAFKAFKEFDLDVEIKINNREILDAIMKYAGIDSSKIETIILTIDKLDKIHEEGVKKELKEKNLDEDQIERIFNIISIKGSNKDKIIRLKDLIEDNEGIKEIEELIQYCPNVFLDLSLARGLAYYTGTIFEIFSKSGKSAICSGGRYDNMIGNFLGNKQKYPAVGISFGLDRIALLLKKEKKTTVKVYIIPIKTTEQSFKLLNNIRDDGINADIDIMGRNISKNLDYANVLSIPYVIFIGDDEIKLQKYKLRDMKTGKEELLNYQQLINKLK